MKYLGEFICIDANYNSFVIGKTYKLYEVSEKLLLERVSKEIYRPDAIERGVIVINNPKKVHGYYKTILCCFKRNTREHKELVRKAKEIKRLGNIILLDKLGD